MKKALVTGGAGFIGSHMADRLIKNGYDVVVIDNESTGFRENIPKDVVYIKGDVRDVSVVEKAFKYKLDCIFHIAGQASTIFSFMNPFEDITVNLHGTVNLVNLSLKYKVPRFLYASSMTTYGHPEKLPVTEDCPLNPISYYGISKLAAEKFVHTTGKRNDLDFEFNPTSFRMFNVYGERQSLENPYQGVSAIFISNLLNNKPITIHSDGEQSRDFVHIDDVVEAWMKSLNNPASFRQIFNLGSGERVSINTLVDIVLDNFDKSRESYKIVYAKERPGDQRHMEADIQRAEKILGWKPEVPFDQGMKRTIKWARDKLK